MEKLVLLLQKKNVQLSLVTVLSTSVGAAGGYFFAKNRLRTYYEDIATREIEEAKEFYGRLHKNTEETSSPEKILEKLHGAAAVEAATTAFQSYSNIKSEAPVPTEADLIVNLDEPDDIQDDLEEAVIEEIRNVFADHAGGFDYEVEVSKRTEFEPYIITEDEYLQDEMGYEQSALTYYEEDGVLADDEDIPVPDSDALVGDDHLVRFGHGSRNENVVFVRNDRLEMEFEIERSNGSYTKEVAGFDEESIKHSDSSGIRKFRRYDE